MPENNNSENEMENESNNVVLAKLEDGEALIPHELVEKYKEAVEELKNKHIEDSKESEINNVISFDKLATSPNPSVVSNDDNVIGSGSAERKEAVKQEPAIEKEKVAVYSTKNVNWSGVGQVSKGYNIVTKQASEKWATRDHIRIATPEEVAGEYGI